MRFLASVGVFAVLVACTPLTEREIAEREYRRGEFRAKFLEFRRECEARGGTVVVRSRRRVGPDRIPQLGDHYYCDSP